MSLSFNQEYVEFLSSVDGITESRFWDALEVLIERPHLVNTRLMFAKTEVAFSVILQNKKYETSIHLNDILKIKECVLNAGGQDKEYNVDTVCNAIKQLFSEIECINKADVWPLNTPNAGIVIYRYLVPKQPEKHNKTQEIVVLDKPRCCVSFFPIAKEEKYLCVPPYVYSLSLLQGRICLKIHDAKSTDSSIAWLSEKLLPKIAKWATATNQTPTIQSLSLISADRYSEVYQQLKMKYGKYLVSIWPESTDPKKFVYEDLAIAAYLLVLWEKEQIEKKLTEKQTFVDVGCGNGLLVHVLASEGHKGIGVDVQKRGIWDMYGPSTELREQAITPSAKSLFPEFDWIIGNHSDELTPWIPVIAARSSHKARVFLLPCCAYDFKGKYIRTHSGISLYQSYLKYVEEICSEMGFFIQWDRLRIPSTKRICLVCSSRKYNISQEAEIDEHRSWYINNRTSKCGTTAGDEMLSCHEDVDMLEHDASQAISPWMDGFKVREKQKQMNCTQLDRAFLNGVVQKIMNTLLAKQDNPINIPQSQGSEEDRVWNKGGCMHLEELATLLGPEILAKLKNQCGGLQTLVRNHKHILKVEKGIVSINLSEPYSKQKASLGLSARSKKKKKKNPSKSQPSVRSKPCWFFNMHPQKCPLTAEDCTYAHIPHQFQCN